MFKKKAQLNPRFFKEQITVHKNKQFLIFSSEKLATHVVQFINNLHFAKAFCHFPNAFKNNFAEVVNYFDLFAGDRESENHRKNERTIYRTSENDIKNKHTTILLYKYEIKNRKSNIERRKSKRDRTK